MSSWPSARSWGWRCLAVAGLLSLPAATSPHPRPTEARPVQEAISWPRRANEALVLRAGRGELSIGVRLAGARPAVATWLGEQATYDGALGPGTSWRLEPRRGGVEDAVSFARAPGREEVTYEVDVRRVAGVRQVGGVVEFLDAGGTPRLRMADPYIEDLDGRRWPARVEVGCAHDESTRAPWGRAVVAPGVETCVIRVSWGGQGVTYPAVLDPAWTVTEAMAQARQFAVSFVRPDGRVMVSGGTLCQPSGCTGLTSSEIYDPGTQSWSMGPAMPSTHRDADWVVVPGQGVLAAGGLDDVKKLSHGRTDWYDLAKDAWEVMPPMPHARYQQKMAVLAGRAFAFGGLTSPTSNAITAIDEFDLTKRTWSSVDSSLHPRALPTATALPGKGILLIGGSETFSINFPTPFVELYDPVTHTSTELPAMKTARLAHTANRMLLDQKDVVLVTGGITEQVEAFDLATSAWFTLPPMADKRSLHAARELSDGSLLVIGGIDGTGVGGPLVERLDPASLTWKKAQPLHGSRAEFVAERLGPDHLLVAGGTTTYLTMSASLSSSEEFRLLAQGEACQGSGDCAGLRCVDGVCCASACDGVCEACSQAKTQQPDGECHLIPAGSSPDDECPAQSLTTCGTTGVCDGKGACARYAPGTPCGQSSCKEGVSTSKQCDGQGMCLPQSASCGLYFCQDPTACATACDDDAQCAPGGHCSGKQCQGDLGVGQACSRAAQCVSGFCVDGVCCESACEGTCRACAASQKQSESEDGVCGPAKAGSNPRDLCTEDPVGSCARSGVCDAQGECASYAAGVPCGAGTCQEGSAGVTAVQFACNGAGSCETATITCGLYGCSGGICNATCAQDEDCVATAYCAQGICQARKAIEAGQTCQADHECLDGFCVDGFCCNTPCLGSCEACDTAGAQGSCVVVSGQPHGERAACPASAGQPCSQRVCDGQVRESCEGFVGDEIACRAAACSAGTATRAASCDGKGHCPDEETRLCAPYVCLGSGCGASCATDADCDVRFQCDGQECTPRSTAVCLDDRTLLSPDGKQSSCAPYRCEGSACRPSCASVLDCVLPSVCDETSHACVPPRPNPQADSGCHVASAPGRPVPASGLLLAALLASLRRRRARLGRAAAAATLLAGCSGESAPSAPEPPGPSLAPAAPAAPARLAVTSPRASAPRVSLPTHPDDAVRVFAASSPFGLSLRLSGARPGARTERAGGVSFAGTLGAETVWKINTTGGGFEDTVSFARAPGREEVTYEVDVRRVAGVRQVGGVVELLDAGGAPRWRMSAPRVESADGRQVSARVEVGCAHDESTRAPWGRAVVAPGVETCAIRVSWAGQGVTYPAVLDPAWTATGFLNEGRRSAVSGLLKDGRFLVAGGIRCYTGPQPCERLLTSEIYDPATGTWAMTGKLNESHFKGLSEVTPKLGVVAVGGELLLNGTTTEGTTAEHYDEGDATWKLLPSSPGGHTDGTFTLLADGVRVVATGGYRLDGVNSTNIDVLDTEKLTWTTVTQAVYSRLYTTATLLPDGRVLLAGGSSCDGCDVLALAELFDPSTGSSQALPDMPTPRSGHLAALLGQGTAARVVLTGGISKSSDLFDPSTLTWTPGPLMVESRGFASGVVLGDGTWLVAGGLPFPPVKNLLTSERFDLASMRWLPAGMMVAGLSPSDATPQGHVLAMATRLPDGRAIVAGGVKNLGNDSASLAGVDLFQPLASGAPCQGSGECASLACVDGVCCASACDGVCEACAKAKTQQPDGQCQPIAVGQDPDDDCAPQAPETCGSTGSCDGQRACALHPAKTSCGLSLCVKGVLNQSQCDGGGKCKPQELSCYPYLCQDSSTCATACVTDAQCSLDAHCVNGACQGDLTTGQPCTTASACASGFCVDGVCCESACEGTCRACAASQKQDASADGVCGPAKAGSNPRDLCSTDPVSSCDRSGVCDAQGECARYAAATPCGAALCSEGSDGARALVFACDGQGSCVTKVTECGIAGCVEGECSAVCDVDADCSLGARCLDGVCQARAPQGSACVAGEECQSGFCVDGVCCNKVCEGSCEACDEQGAVGSCIPVAGLPRPGHPACAAGASGAVCAQRVCDSKTRATCEGLAGPAVVCRAAACVDGVATTAGVCDGEGSCRAPESEPCEPFACEGAVCATACTADAACSPKFRCDTARKKCVPRTGAFCQDDHTLIQPDGLPLECAPYRCEGSACKKECSSVLDCASPSVCDETTHRCLAPEANPSQDGGCQAAAGTPGAGGAWLAALLLGLRGRRRRAS